MTARSGRAGAPALWLRIGGLAILMLAGCQAPARTKNAAVEGALPPIPDPNCRAMDDTCPPMMAMASTGAPMVLEEYGISARFPAGSRVCYGLSGPHAHGFYTRVGDVRAECHESADPPVTTVMGVWGDFNGAEWTSLDALPLDDCSRTGAGDDLIASNGRSFAFRDHRSLACEIIKPDGLIEISVRALAGEWQSDLTRIIPGTEYYAYLRTTRARFADDKPMFERFLAGLTLSAPIDLQDCFWTKGDLQAANGTPSFRITVAGTGRVLGLTTPEGPEAVDVLPKAARAAIESRGDVFMTRVTGDWRVCPLAPERAGWMRAVRLVEARDLTVSRR